MFVFDGSNSDWRMLERALSCRNGQYCVKPCISVLNQAILCPTHVLITYIGLHRRLSFSLYWYHPKIGFSVTWVLSLVTFFPYCLQERLMLVDRESRILQTLSRDLLRLEKSHVTRHGGECGGETSEVNITYFCHETLGSMNQLINALSDFHHKLAKLVGWQNNFSKR